MPDIPRLSMDELLARASHAVGKVDALGLRGCTLITLDEIEAMAGLLACLGLVPTPPGETAPSEYFLNPSDGGPDGQ